MSSPRNHEKKDIKVMISNIVGAPRKSIMEEREDCISMDKDKFNHSMIKTLLSNKIMMVYPTRQ